MGVIKTKDTKARRFQDAKGMFVTPYLANGELGADTYDIHDIVGDTLSLTQDDAERTEIPWEFGDAPLDENTSLGTKNFTCQCLDFQNDIMKALFGCTIDEVSGAVVFPSEYKDLFVMIRVVFEDVDFVLPYVKMDAKPALENMRSDIARGELSGTVYSKEIKLGVVPAAGGQTGSPADTVYETPMIYVPTAYAVYVKSGAAYKTDYREPSTIETVTITLTNPTNGTVEGLVPGANTVVKGQFVTLKAVPADGYNFSKFTIASEDIAQNPVGFAANANATVAVTFVSA